MRMIKDPENLPSDIRIQLAATYLHHAADQLLELLDTSRRDKVDEVIEMTWQRVLSDIRYIKEIYEVTQKNETRDFFPKT